MQEPAIAALVEMLTDRSDRRAAAAAICLISKASTGARTRAAVFAANRDAVANSPIPAAVAAMLQWGAAPDGALLGPAVCAETAAIVAAGQT